MILNIVSSFAIDRLIFESKIEEKSGGPAQFICNFLDENHIKYNLLASRDNIVEIDMRDNLEIGKIIQTNKLNFKKENIKSEHVIISTLCNEIEFKVLTNFTCVDIQGFLRDMNKLNSKNKFDHKDLEKVKILKGTKEELEYLPQNKLKKIEIVLETEGSNGFRVYDNLNNKVFLYSVEKINCINSIGAGDTFFIAFCYKYFNTNNINQSAIYSKEIVTNFLKNK